MGDAAAALEDTADWTGKHFSRVVNEAQVLGVRALKHLVPREFRL